MNIKLTKEIKAVEGRTAVVVPVFADKKSTPIPAFIADLRNIEVIKDAISCFSWGARDSRSIYVPNKENGRDLIVLLVGLGDRKNWNVRQLSLFFRRVVPLAKSEKVQSIIVPLEMKLPVSIDEALEIAGTNFLTADFEFNKYKTPPESGWPKIGNVYLMGKFGKRAEDFLKRGIILGEEINNCRDLANTPGGDMTPKMLAEHAVSDGKRAGFKVNILDEKEIEKLGMGGLMGVSRGSLERPRFIIAEYFGGKKSAKPIVIVGKGVTFDSGGLNIKPTGHIYEMHLDMSGGAAALHAIAAIARAKLKVNVVVLVPAVENMPSGSSYRPGDILKTITGKTIEVLNTDAEGRIILADGLGYAQRYNPEIIIDVATLTGGAMVAVGQRKIALFTNDDKLESLIKAVGERSNEPVWPLPVDDEYLEDIRSVFADVANDGKNKYGAATQGAIFLKQFVGDYKWAHLDIAPTMTTIDGQYLAKGASGTSVGLLYKLAEKIAGK